MIDEIERIRDAMLAQAQDDHTREIALRGFMYAASRINDGSATTAHEAKMAFAAFADGFCTGFHRGTGTPCTRG